MKHIFLLVLLSSCLHRGPRIELEQGVVIGKKFTEGYTHTYTTMMAYPDGNGNQMWIPEIHNDYIPPTYVTSFKCQHKRIFNIDNRDVYETLKQLDTVTIEYYNLLNGNDEIKDFDFITAYKQKK